MRGAQRRSGGRCRGGGDLALEAATEAGPARKTTKERGRYGSVTRFPLGRGLTGLWGTCAPQAQGDEVTSRQPIEVVDGTNCRLGRARSLTRSACLPRRLPAHGGAGWSASLILDVTEAAIGGEPTPRRSMAAFRFTVAS